MSQLRAIPSLPTNKRYKRLYSGALDDTSEHLNMDAMLQYLLEPTSYPGQVIYCTEEDKLYRIGLDEYNNKILKEIGVTSMNAENILYTNPLFPEITNLKQALDYLFENSLSSVNDDVVYYGVSNLDGIDKPLSTELIVSTFSKANISEPSTSSDLTAERENRHVRINYGVNEEPKYFFLAIPINNGKPKARDLSTPFGDGWFNWGISDENYIKTITLPNVDGFLQEYILLRSDNMLIDGRSWMFYFNNNE